ncbi:hypothetical protein ACKFKF_29790 [Phormidesmis sp. 146-12]
MVRLPGGLRSYEQTSPHRLLSLRQALDQPFHLCRSLPLVRVFLHLAWRIAGSSSPRDRILWHSRSTPLAFARSLPPFALVVPPHPLEQVGLFLPELPLVRMPIAPGHHWAKHQKCSGVHGIGL